MNGKKSACFLSCLLVLLVVLVNPVYAQQKGGMGCFSGGVGWPLESGNSSILHSTGGGGHSAFGPENAGGYGFLNVGYALLMTDVILVLR